MSSAHISTCGKYRYKLTRGGMGPALCFVMLNPSTADANVDDPTIRRCRGFSEELGFNGRFTVVNLYALRTPHPGVLLKAIHDGEDAVGPLNQRAMYEVAGNTQLAIVMAWGANAPSERAKEVTDFFRRHRSTLYCFGKNKGGSPKHPLYLTRDSQLQPF